MTIRSRANDVVAPDELLDPLLDYLARRVRAEAKADLRPFGIKVRYPVALTALHHFSERGQPQMPWPSGWTPPGS